MGRPLWIIWSGAFAFFLSFFLLLSALPLYARSLGVSDSGIGLVMGSFAVTSMLLRPWAGWACDRFGRRPLMVAGAAIFTLAALAYAWSGGVVGLTLARLAHGAGMGLYPTAVSALVTDIAPPSRRGEVLGLLGAAGSLGTAVGPVAGIAVVERAGFGALFAVSGAIAFTALLLTGAVTETTRAATAAPFDLRTTISRAALFPSAIVLCSMLTYGAQVSFLPLYAEAHGVNAGVFFVFFAVVLTIIRARAGMLSDRFGRPPVAAAGLVVVAAALGALALSGTATGIALAGALYGVGFGLVQPALMAWCVDVARPGDRGRAMGTYYTALELGIAIGAMSSGVAVTALGFVGTFVVVAAAALVGAGLALTGRVVPARG